MNAFVKYWYGHGKNTSEHVAGLISFDHESKHSWESMTARGLASLLMLVCIAGFAFFPWTSMFIFASNWPIFSLTAHLIFAFKLSLDK